MLQLISPTLKYQDQFASALTEFDSEDRIAFWNRHQPITSIADYIQQTKDHSQGKNLPPGHLPHSTFWLMEDDEFIGHTNIRHSLNDHLLNVGGQIGYYIRPSKRRQGYGKKILALALIKAKELGLKKVVITCDASNIGSAKVIEHNGGVFENEHTYDPKLEPKRRYWITL